MASTSTLNNDGQITIPTEVRKRLGLKAGDSVEFAVEGDHTVIRPAVLEDDPFEKWVGAFPAFKSREEINPWIADMRDGDEGPEESWGK
jgi:AbrB family looped-hinge helix DNA binding protein